MSADDEFEALGESVPAAIKRMVYDAQIKAHTIWYAGSFVDWSNSINGRNESVLIGIDVGIPNPDYRILVTDEKGNQTTYDDFEVAMQAVAWGNIRVAISRLRNQIEEMGKAFARVDLSAFDWLRPQRIPVYDEPPPREPHHAHLIQRHIRSVRKPAKHARNSRQTMVATIPCRQKRRHKRTRKKME